MIDKKIISIIVTEDASVGGYCGDIVDDNDAMVDLADVDLNIDDKEETE